MNEQYTDKLPESVQNDERLGKRAQDDEGMEGIIDSIHRFLDGLEYFHLYNEKTGLGHGGLEASQITILE